MKRFMVSALAVLVLGAVLTACLPPPPPPPPPPPKFKLEAGLWRTDGTAPGATECRFQRVTINPYDDFTVVSTHGARYAHTRATDVEFKTEGCLPWRKWTDTSQVGASPRTIWHIPEGPWDCCEIFHPRQNLKDGDYIVGRTIWPTGPWDPKNNPPIETGDIGGRYGTLGVAGGDHDTKMACHWQIVGDWTGENVLRYGTGYGDGSLYPGAISYKEGEGIRLQNCNGMWTPGS